MEEVHRGEEEVREIVANDPVMAASSMVADTYTALRGIETAMLRVLGLTVPGLEGKRMNIEEKSGGK